MVSAVPAMDRSDAVHAELAGNAGVPTTGPTCRTANIAVTIKSPPGFLDRRLLIRTTPRAAPETSWRATRRASAAKRPVSNAPLLSDTVLRGPVLRDPVHQLFELRDQSCGDRSDLAITDGAVVDGYHGNDLCGAPGEEAFVGHEEIVSGHGFFACGDVEFPGQF